MQFNTDEISSILATKNILSKNLFDKFNELGSSELYGFFLENAIVSGGSISSIYHRETPNDYDIYLKDENHLKQFNELIQSSSDIKNLIKDMDEKYMVETSVKGKLVTVNATTFKNDIQVITRSDTTDRLEFDFIHCMPWYDFGLRKLFISRQQYDCIEGKLLVKNPRYNLEISDKRLSKYKNRGWRFRPEK